LAYHPGVDVRREALRGLRSKYEEMLSMRLADAAGTDGGPARVRQRMRQLADRYPGALREIDDLPLDEIRGRLDALDAALAKGAADSAHEPWMHAVARFHALTRGILVTKRWLGRRKRIDGGLQERFERELADLPFPEDSRAWAPHLSSVASPPRGRLVDAVFARIAGELGLPERAVRSLVFGGPTR
jgi:hypothetical protein